MKTKLSLKKALENKAFAVIYESICTANQCYENNNDFLKSTGMASQPVVLGNCIPDNNRIFPADEQTLEEFNLNTGSDVDYATVHTSSYADGLARSLHSLALVIGTDIYFRSNAYKPETEEGRKTITHELTHVAQYKNRPLADNRTKEEFEVEATAAEQTAESIQSGKIKMTVCGQDYYMSERQHRQFMGMLKEAVENELDWMKYTKKPEEYDKIMKAYRRRKERRELPWQRSY